ncbi:hypothetical protein F0562_001846 [Nyssa sinensis]|uniref:Uncharacterized protein n=1 Tax=Nyssa sinensis TaxID=561372 RepID=A0A5J5C4C6_9ASTE|nr:hypothetical protein F0562_001846 [Nyssa sinensis]
MDNTKNDKQEKRDDVVAIDFPSPEGWKKKFVRGFVTIMDPKMIDDLQSELDQTRLRLVAVWSSAFATKAKSTEALALLSILASEQDFLAQKWEVLDLAGAWSVDDEEDDCDEDDVEHS